MISDSLFSVAGQVVLAVGASRGIGEALAGGFAARGATVIIAGRDAATLEATRAAITRDVPVEAVACDVAKGADVTRLVAEVIERHGRIDTLLNVAGINVRKRVESYTEEEFDRILGVNLRGHFLVAQAVGRRMLERGAGSIINIDSLNTYAPLKGVTPYAMSKGGVNMMTRGMANEWGGRGVRVNAIAPGFFPTALSKKLWQIPKMQDWVKEVTPMQRLGDVEELVGTAIFLASKASAFMTGQILRVDGGITAGIHWPIDLE